MDSQFWLNVVVRWIHVTSAVVGVGGAAFLLWVLLPSARAVGPDAARPVLEIVYRRFRWLVRSVIALLLLSGAYNLFVVIPRARALGSFKPVYHGLLGTKILLALALFGIAEALLASSGGAARLLTGRTRGLAAGVGLALLILFLSASLRRLWDLDVRLRAPAPGQPAVRESRGPVNPVTLPNHAGTETRLSVKLSPHPPPRSGEGEPGSHADPSVRRRPAGGQAPLPVSGRGRGRG
jgi:uncharacterized membrane protein